MLGTLRRRPLGLSALLLAGIACLLALVPALARAQGAPLPASSYDPMSTNIPTLGWRGDMLRLVKCTDNLSSRELNALSSAGGGGGPFIITGIGQSFTVEEWGGNGGEP